MENYETIAKEMATTIEMIVREALSRREASEHPSPLMQKRASHQKQCLFWDCSTPIRSEHLFCRPHFMSFEGNLIDECLGCNRAKDKQYELCLDCHNGRPPQQYRVDSTKSHDQQKQCRFWNCNTLVPPNHFLCRPHFKAFQENSIDECSNCNELKGIQYELCLNCRNGPPVQQQQASMRVDSSYKWYKKEHFSTWNSTAVVANEFFVYILKLEGGRFYAGQTRELRERLSEHRDGNTKSTARKNPKLVWFVTLPSHDAATSMEVELKRLIDANPREIRRMVVRFEDLIRELDYS